MSCVSTCDGRFRWFPTPPAGSNLSLHGARVALYYCSSTGKVCEARVWFADGRDCLDFEKIAWSACELDAGFMMCREDARFGDAWKTANKTRCSYRQLEWEDVADGGPHTAGGQCVR